MENIFCVSLDVAAVHTHKQVQIRLDSCSISRSVSKVKHPGWKWMDHHNATS